jgi:hypothetical protein
LVHDKLDKDKIANISSYLYNDFIKNSEKYKSFSYFQKCTAGRLLMFKIMQSYFLNENLHVEELIRQIPIHIASRLSLFNLIDNAEKKGIIKKENSNGLDKRKKIITPSEALVKEYKDWLHHYINQLNS